MIPTEDTCDIGIQTFEGILDLNYSNNFSKNLLSLWETSELFDDAKKDERSQSIIALTGQEEEIELSKPPVIKQVSISF